MIHSRIGALGSALLALTLTCCDDGAGQADAGAALDIGRPSLGDTGPPDATMDAAPPTPEAGTPDADPPDAAPNETLCQGAGQRGLLSEPVSIFDGAAYAPRMTVANDGSYALAWLIPDDAGPLKTVWFGRLNADVEAVTPQSLLVRSERVTDNVLQVVTDAGSSCMPILRNQLDGLLGNHRAVVS